MRYLTSCSLNARNSSLRSSGIIGWSSFVSSSEGISGCAHIPNGRESRANRQTLPVLIRLDFLLVRVGDSANCLIYTHDQNFIGGTQNKRKRTLPCDLCP